jgi:CxC2 like cysteine cluster associated with KDZ transposases
MSSYIKKKKSYRRQRPRLPMVDGDVDSSEAVTHTRIAVPQADGTFLFKNVLESLDSTSSSSFSAAMDVDVPPPLADNYNDIPNHSRAQSPQPRKGRTQKDYILEYVARIDHLLEASLGRESLAEDDKNCRHCSLGALAIWRCKDCSMGLPLCRFCIRTYHKDNPFHRIEKWNGDYFRPAELWEVGIYLLIRHYTGNPICDNLDAQIKFLEVVEAKNDNAEQVALKASQASDPLSAPQAPELSSMDNRNDEIDIPNSDNVVDNDVDAEFIRYFQDLRQDDDKDLDDSKDVNGEEDFIEDDMEEEEIDSPNVIHYLPDEIMKPNQTGPEPSTAQQVIGTYIRVVHLNGIHNIAMISCECHGHDELSSDLIASRLLPASFERIRTLFSAQVLDHFRLCNLELKASAYHFYHLIQRLTNPMNPAEVVNLYREFRRMSRIWRWMKRLKWAGYGGLNKKSTDVKDGELTIFCPACPQPGINIPANWKEDSARQVLFLYIIVY